MSKKLADKDKDTSISETPAAENTPTLNEIAWAGLSVLLLGGKDFPKYNPDLLLSAKGAAIYRKMLWDEQIKAVTLFKRDAILSRGYSFEVKTDDDGKKDVAQNEMADFFQFVIDSIEGSFREALNGILTGIPFGFSLTEKIYRSDLMWEGRPMWGLKALKLRPYDTFLGGFYVDEHGNVDQLKQIILGHAGSSGLEIPYDKMIHFVFQPDVDTHYGESDLKATYRSWWSKDIAIKFQNIFLERYASGFPVVTLEGTLPPSKLTNLKAALRTISANTGMILPANAKMEMFQPHKTDAYEKAINRHDTSIARGMLVPNLMGMTPAAQTGSYSQSQTQLEAFFWVLDAIAERLGEVLNEQVFRELALWNFGTEEYPKFVFDPVSDYVKIEIAKVWGELVSKGAVERSDSDERYFRSILRIPEKEESSVKVDPDKIDSPDDDDNIDGGGIGDTDDILDDKLEQLKLKYADKPWLKRVNFKKIKKTMDNLDKNFIRDFNPLAAGIRLSLEKQFIKIVGTQSMGNLDPKVIETLTISNKTLSDIRKAVRNNLQDNLDHGYVSARSELPKQSFAQGVIAPGMDLTQAEKFLARKSFHITGVYNDDVLKSAKQVLENGIKYDKTLRQVLVDLEEDARLGLYLPEVDSAGRAVNVPARMLNIVRTNSAEAWNQGRQALFGSPELKGYVVAYDYSAVMDERTTDICASLHGRVRKDWGSYTPPNHFMCRSILVSVTQVDDWDGKQSTLGSVEPQEGFK